MQAEKQHEGVAASEPYVNAIVLGKEHITSTPAFAEDSLLSERKSYLESTSDGFKVCESNSSYPDLGERVVSGGRGCMSASRAKTYSKPHYTGLVPWACFLS